MTAIKDKKEPRIAYRIATHLLQFISSLEGEDNNTNNNDNNNNDNRQLLLFDSPLIRTCQAVVALTEGQPPQNVGDHLLEALQQLIRLSRSKINAKNLRRKENRDQVYQLFQYARPLCSSLAKLELGPSILPLLLECFRNIKGDTRSDSSSSFAWFELLVDISRSLELLKEESLVRLLLELSMDTEIPVRERCMLLEVSCSFFF